MDRISPAFGAGLLLLCGILLAWPIASGGWLTYFDNPAHVAEIHSLAFDDGGGWSDIAWLGFPLGQLHSPLWYGGLAHLVRWGLPLGPAYALVVVLGFLTPPLVLFWIARRRAALSMALLLAWLLMVQKTSLIGFGSPLGGMWTFYISCGALLLLIQRLASGRDRVADLFWIAGLFGFIGLTHLFSIIPGIIIFVIHAAVRLVRRENPRFLLAQGMAAGLGAAASAGYWAPVLLAGDGVDIISYNLPPLKLLARLLFGTSAGELRKVDADLLAGVSVATALPQILLVAAGMAGVVLNGRDRSAARSRLPIYGFALAGVIMILLLVLGLFQSFGRDITWLGHVSWRFLFFVRLGLALAAIPVFARLGAWIALRKAAAWRTVAVGAGAILLVLFSWSLSKPLGALILHSDSSEMQEVRRLWTWLEENHDPAWGRVYLQDTFGGSGILGNSHVLALTHRETGIDQVGPLYEGSPFPTVPWLVAESRKIFGSPLRSAADFTRMLQLVPAANVTRLVLYWPDLAAEMVKKGYAEYEYNQGGFAVLALVDNPHSSWAAPLERGVTAAAARVATGRWRVTTDAPATGGSALVKASWSPHWKVAGDDGPTVARNELGLISLVDLPAGRHVTMLEYGPPRWPGRVSLAGWGLWLVLLAGWRFVPALTARFKAVEEKAP